MNSSKGKGNSPKKNIFLFKFVNLYDRSEIYENYMTTAVGHDSCRLTAVAYGG
jgi:hypothetical protein